MLVTDEPLDKGDEETLEKAGVRVVSACESQGYTDESVCPLCIKTEGSYEAFVCDR